MRRVEPHSDVREYFRQRLAEVLERRNVQPSETTEFYLVQLLARYARAPAESVQRPLVYRLAEALQTPEPGNRLRRFREMGDAALYTCGFFDEHLRRRGVSRHYVVAMGGKAYSRAGRLAPSGPASDAALQEAYEELGARFDDFARVLDDMCQLTSLRTPQDIVRLYSRWRRTHSARLAERLRQAGVYPQREPGSTLH